MATKALSPTMTECLRKLQQAGELKRLPGGFWVKPETKFDQTGKPNGSWWGTTTIEALVARGVAEYSDWEENRKGGKFPVSVRFSATARDESGSAQ